MFAILKATHKRNKEVSYSTITTGNVPQHSSWDDTINLHPETWREDSIVYKDPKQACKQLTEKNPNYIVEVFAVANTIEELHDQYPEYLL